MVKQIKLYPISSVSVNIRFDLYSEEFGSLTCQRYKEDKHGIGRKRTCVIGDKMLQRHLNDSLEEAIDLGGNEINAYLKSEGTITDPFDISGSL